VVGLLTAVLTAAALRASQSLGSELLRRNLPVPKDAPDLEQPITSYSVLDDERGFVIAYYELGQDSVLHELRVRSYDRGALAWKSATFQEIGSVLSIQRGARFLYLTGHSSPSASSLMVLDEGLRLKKELDGFLPLVLSDGRVVFIRSMIHFSPTHAEVLAIYDPLTDCEQSIFPPGDVQNNRGGERVPGMDVWVDRSFDQVRTGREAGTIEFLAVSQRMRLNPHQEAEPTAPEERAFVTCNVAQLVPICRTRPAPK